MKVKGIENVGADNSAKGCCPDLLDNINEYFASKYSSVVRRQYYDYGMLLSESPQKVWNDISETVGYDMTNVQCPELFTKEKPNDYTPNLDEVLSRIREVVRLRIEDEIVEDVIPIEAELYGVYCALFLRAHMEDILSQEVIENYPCLSIAVDYITYHCEREELRSFWCGFESYLPIVTNDKGMRFLHKFSSTDFGSLMAYEFLAYCDAVKNQLKEIIIPELLEFCTKANDGRVIQKYKKYYDTKLPY